ncbi:MAG: ATP-binding protein, partial [Promethearchaeota archaeon]
MRKRTQLVGFEFGYWKHSQYITEFLDNSLDAIETFHWKEIEKSDSRNKFSLDQETALENLSLMQDLLEEETFDSDDKEELSKEKEEEAGEIIDKAEIEVEEEVQRIIDDLDELIKPVADLVDIEPIVVVRLRESEPPSFLTSELSQKNVMNYTIEIFDNGIGMSKGDLRKFGKYLASSKSVELKQTRGSQGFGAPSAFSDAQNTTGKPIIVASKTSDMVYANTSEFFTTSKNEKRYLIHPVDFDSPFGHGTYIKLNYLNVKYVRGYVDTYINETALMNPHITILFIDPYGEQITYPRLVSSFPKQPKYAKPHPSSTNIGDLQDLIAKSENLTVSAFLQENFVRISPKIAKEIINIAEKDLQDKNNLLILKEGFITKSKKKEDPIYLLKKEKRVYGRSEKLRDKIIIYSLESDDLKNDYWNLVSEFIKWDKKLVSIDKSIKKQNRRIETVDTKKEQKTIKKEVDNLVKEINKINKQKEEIKNQLFELIKRKESGLVELKKFPSRTEYEDLKREVQISKAKPVELSNEQ